MSDHVPLKEEVERPGTLYREVVEAKGAGGVIQQQNKGWLKRMLPAICCGAPLLLVAAVSLFGLSLGAIASGFLSLAAVLACPLGMYLMMRMMNKK
jgi:hypothetical protein